MVRLSEEERLKWAQRIEDQRASGLSIKRWCESKKIWSHAFYYWKRELAVPTFHEIVESLCRVEIDYQGVKIQIESSSLSKCLAVFKELKC